ncbi:MAG: DUF3084 domain-containing protein [Fimbriimonadaceae bacterium]
MKIDPTSLWFLIFMVLAGGTVSYYGDILGRKLGKKRITIHKKIRPKKFAAAMTFIFGALGTALTIAVLFLVSEPVRTWIIEGNDAKARLAVTTKNLKDAEKKFSDAQSKLTSVETERADLTVQVNKKTKELEDAKIEQLTLNSKNKALDRQGKDLLKRVSHLTNQFKVVNSQVKDLKSQKEVVQNELSKASSEKIRVTTENQEFQKRNLELEREAIRLEGQSKQLQKEYRALQSEFDDLENASKQANAKFNSQLKSYQDDLSKAEVALRKTLSELEYNNNAIEAFRTSQNVMKVKLQTSRYNALIYTAGAEINRTIIQTGMSQSEIGDAITVFLKQTASIAKQSGAEQTFEGSYAGLLDDIVKNPNTNVEQSFTVQEQLQFLQTSIYRRKSETVLIAVSKFNAFQKEFIPIELQVFDNILAFEQGEVVFTMQVDGRKPVVEIATSIIEQIDKGLGKTLAEHNMIPIIGSARPFGEFGNEKVIEIALEVKESGIPLRLQLLATKDTFSADRIQFSHRLRP